MALADARAMYPSLPVVEADLEADRASARSDRRLVRPLYAAGRARSAGRLAARRHRLRASVRRRERRWPAIWCARLTQQGLAARAAVADTVGCAWGVARYGEPGHRPARRNRSRAMLPLPIAALRVDAETVAGLKTAGLTRVADLAARPRAPFAARFGSDAGAPSRSGARARRRADHAAPAAAGGDGRAALSRADRARGRRARHHRASGAQLALVLERRGEGGRLFQVALFRADGKVHRLEIGTGSPLRDPARVRKAVRGAARRPRRRLRSGLRLRHGAALGAGHRAHAIRRRPASPGPTTPRSWRI